MSLWLVVLIVLVGLALARGAVAYLRARAHPRVAEIRALSDDTGVDDGGAVRSIQRAEMRLPAAALDTLWSPAQLENLARTYWRFLSRVTFGLIRVSYTPGERFVCFIGRPFVLLRFQKPEYEMSADRGVVRWRIEKGLLVAKAGRGGRGYLEIEVERRPAEREGWVVATVKNEVANFYPSISSSIGAWVYRNTQSRIHVILTYGFLRSLARLDLAHSQVGSLAGDAGQAAVAEPDAPSAQG